MDHRPVVVAITVVVLGGLVACGSSPASPGPSFAAGGSASASATVPGDSPEASPTVVLPRTGGTWETGTPTPSRRAENAAAALDGVIYLAGGLDGRGDALTTFEAFDTRTGSWSSLPPLPERRDHFGLVAHDGKIYLTGGGIFFTGAIRAGTWAYDPAVARWTALAPMPAPRSQHGSAVMGGKIYVVGGVVRGPDQRALWAYDPESGQWQADLAPMPTVREHLSVVEAGGRLIALGGRKTQNLGAVEAYDPATNRWETLPSMPTPRGGMAAGVIGTSIHTAGGENLNALKTHPEHEVLDLATMTWSKGPDLPTKRHGLAASVVDGRWFVIGGGRSAMLSVSDIVEVFTP